MSERYNSTTSLTHSTTDPSAGQKLEEATTQENVTVDDTAKLRMLGYDAVLGRPLGFWSSSAMNFCHLSFMIEYVILTGMYAYHGPLLFIIGYPCLFILHLILLGPFAELSSAYPVAGAMATWSWRCARAGVRYERQFGYLVSGIVLAAHLGKTIALSYKFVLGLIQLYILLTDTPYNKLTMEAYEEKAWWKPVFHIILVSFVALVMLTRVARTSSFWIFCGIYTLFLYIAALLSLIWCAKKAEAGLVPHFNLSFRGSEKWPHSFSYMIFAGLPLKVASVDSPAHMSEETEDPAKTVPRVLYASTTLHFICTYTLVVMFILFAEPVANGLWGINPVVPVSIILRLNMKTIYAFAVLAPIGASMQVIASMMVTSRFIFALARDCAIPFSSLLVKTSKNREPWVADLALIGAMYAAIIGWFVPVGNYYSLIQSFSFWFTSLAYLFPLVLYITSKLELQYADRVQFTLRSWSKPLAVIASAWLFLTLIQGSLPSSIWTTVAINKLEVDKLSPLPFVIIGMLFIMFVSWWLYGRRHYIGPIRALTKWSAGVEINPMDFNSAEGRAKAIHNYIQNQISKGKGKSSSNKSNTPPATHLGKSTNSTPGKSFTTRIFGKRPSTSPSASNQSATVTSTMDPFVVPESGVFPDKTQAKSMNPALAESGLLPAQTQITSSNQPALMESQVLPEESQPRILLPTPIMTRGPYIGVIDEHDEHHDIDEEDGQHESFPMSDLSPTQLSRFPTTGSFGTPSFGAAQAESQLDPAGFPAAQVGSQLGANESFDPSAQVESQLEPERSRLGPATRLSQTETQLAALPESQLDPTATAEYGILGLNSRRQSKLGRPTSGNARW